MLLKHIEQETCSTCGSVICKEETRGTHCNGETFEYRTFVCGCEIMYSPNFSKALTHTDCPRTPARIARSKAIEKLATKIKLLVNRSDVDEDIKDRILANVKYMS